MWLEFGWRSISEAGSFRVGPLRLAWLVDQGLPSCVVMATTYMDWPSYTGTNGISRTLQMFSSTSEVAHKKIHLSCACSSLTASHSRSIHHYWSLFLSSSDGSLPVSVMPTTFHSPLVPEGFVGCFTSVKQFVPTCVKLPLRLNQKGVQTMAIS